MDVVQAVDLPEGARLLVALQNRLDYVDVHTVSDSETSAG